LCGQRWRSSTGASRSAPGTCQFALVIYTGDTGAPLLKAQHRYHQAEHDNTQHWLEFHFYYYEVGQPGTCRLYSSDGSDA
jgi:hypothetical protein